jgi:hypothetical protein
MTQKRGWLALVSVMLGALMLLSGYVGAYFALVERPAVVIMNGSGSTSALPRYPQDWMHRVFAPVHSIDREWLRPRFWNPWHP